jgi:hypothetical protein
MTIQRIAPRTVDLDRGAEGIAATPAHKALEAATKAIRKRLPKDGGKLWDWLRGQEQKTLLAVLAVCAGHTVDAVEKAHTADPGMQHAQQLATALKLDMAAYWQPTAAGYFSRVSRRGVRRKRQERLRHAQESGPRRSRRGQAQGIALAPRSPAGSISTGATGSGGNAGAGFRWGKAATAPGAPGALRLSCPCRYWIAARVVHLFGCARDAALSTVLA